MGWIRLGSDIWGLHAVTFKCTDATHHGRLAKPILWVLKLLSSESMNRCNPLICMDGDDPYKHFHNKKMKISRAPRRDNDVDAARTIYWFHSLGMGLWTDVPREIQRAIAPETLALNAHGERIKNNKFLGYSRGEHVPHEPLVLQAEEVVPWSSHALNHPIWQVLRTKATIKKHSRQWVYQLDREIQAVVLSPINEIVGGASRHTLGALERRASLDSLAALTILLRLRHEANEPEWAWLCALSIFRVLLMIGRKLDVYEIAERVFQLYVQRVFSLVVFKKQRIDPANYQYVQFAHLLAELANRVQSKDPQTGNRRMPTFYAIQILDGRYQQVFREYFQIPVVSTEE